MKTTDEILQAYLNTIPPKERDRKLKEALEQSKSKGTDITEVDRAEMDKAFLVEAVVISAIAAKNGQSIEKMMYDLTTSWYGKGANTSDKDFKFPSDLPSPDIETLIDLGVNSDYTRNRPVDLPLDEGVQNEFRDRLLKEFDSKQDKLLELLNKLKK